MCAFPEVVIRKTDRSIRDLGLDLRGAAVPAEAATGPYVVTPVIAALGGDDLVYAMTRSSPAPVRQLMCPIPVEDIESLRSQSRAGQRANDLSWWNSAVIVAR